ncbi:MAG: EVE domain-containing protein [Parachlamydiaceae bacterium]|nr:EVE domain-containing protein [Parachlamydiaceae bacterium]
MSRYWIAVASLEHVQKGMAEGFAQVCHGKPGPLKNMSEGDWIIYYSPTILFGSKEPCRSFTAVGKVKSNDPYQFIMSHDFIPWRRDICYMDSRKVPIEPLLDSLHFIKDKSKWGFPFRRGCFEIMRDDFQIIAKEMGII